MIRLGWKMPLNSVLRSNQYNQLSVLCASAVRDKPRPSPNLCPQRNFSVESVTTAYSSLFMSISQSGAAASMKDLLVTVHDVSGLHWAGTILVTTAGLRLLIMFPLTVYQHQLIAKLELVKFEFNEIVQELKKETAFAVKKFNWTQEQAKLTYNISLKKQWSLLIQRENCHPLKTTIVFWFQLPVWVVLSMTLRNLAYRVAENSVDAQITALQMAVGGPPWATNLLVPDSSLILPVSLTLINLAVIELQCLSRVRPPSRMQTVLTNVFRGFVIIIFPIAMTVPSCMSLYWACSSGMALVQHLTLMSPRVRRACRIPVTPSEPEQPYQLVLDNFKEKYGKYIFR